MSIFLVDSDTSRILKAVRICNTADDDYNDGNIYSPANKYIPTVDGLIEETSVYNPAAHTISLFATYRRYEQNTSKRLNYVIGEGASTDLQFKYLHSDKGLYDDDFDGSVAEASSYQVEIKSHREQLVRGDDGVMEQVLILQGDDNKLYKRGNYHWDLLEGQRDLYNHAWRWVTVFSQRAHIWDWRGEVRFGAGNGATNQAAWYGWIDREYFRNNNDGYADHFSTLSRLDPPPAGLVTGISPVTQEEYALEENGLFDKYTSFQGKVVSAFEEQVGAPGSPAQFIRFYVGLSFEYDNYQESQIRVYDTGLDYGTVSVGIIEGVAPDHALVQIDLSSNSWDLIGSSFNPRITAVNVYFGEVISDAGMEYDEAGYDLVTFYKVKRVLVSGEKPTGENVFADSDPEGSAQWEVAGGGFTLTTYVDYDMWESREFNGNAQDNLGNVLPIYKSTGSWTEVYTKESLIPEGYNYAIPLQNRVYYLGTRLNGKTKDNRLMAAAATLRGVTPDHLTDDPRNIRDIPHDGMGLARIGDRILAVMGSHGHDSYDVTTGFLNKIEDVADVGTDAVGSVTEIIEGGLGNIIRGVVFKDTLGNVRIFDGHGAQIIGDPIFDDFDGSNEGLDSLDATTAQYIYIPQQRLLFLAYGTQVWVQDLRVGGAWYDWRFNNSVNKMSIGVDGEMFFTDGEEMLVYPQAGTVDTPNPIWRSADVPLGEDTRGILKRVHVDYICAGTTLQPAIYKDRGASPTNAGGTLSASSSQSRGRTAYAYGTRIARELALEIHTTDYTKLTSLEIDSIAQQILIEGKKP